ncbi:MAG: 50S ribosomal protein L28 [Candidatus Saganbacteria bacterium]|nr:50S ribosomal protein L28 [Candidatus Saganbacteria bacterium]
MSRKCSICGKEPSFGMNVSHSNKRTKRRWLPNVQKLRILVSGKPVRAYVCTKCLKRGAVKKAV